MNLKPLNIDEETKITNINHSNSLPEKTKIMENSIIIQSDELDLNQDDKILKQEENTKIIALTQEDFLTKTFNLNEKRKNFIKTEKKWKTFSMLTSVLFILSMIIIIISFSTNILPISNYGFYAFPSLIILFFLYVLFNSLIERKSLNKLIENLTFKNDIVSDSLIDDFYIKLQKKQVNSVWFCIFYVFYLGAFTLIFWGIQNQNWFDGFLNFQLWINSSFPEPFTPYWATIFFTSTIISIILITVSGTLIRRNSSINFLTYFGEGIVKIEVVNEIKKSRNKLYAKIFFFSILAILIIPLIFYFVVKGIKK